MPALCPDCLRLVPFGWSEQPCDRCVAESTLPAASPVRVPSIAVFAPAVHSCATLAAFGWDVPDCIECHPVALVTRPELRVAALVA